MDRWTGGQVSWSLEQAVELGVDVFDYGAKVFGVFTDFKVVGIDDEQFAEFVPLDPVFIHFIQVFKVIEPDGVFILPAPFLDLAYQG